MATVTGTDKHLIISGEQIEEVVGKVPTIEADVKTNKQSISALQTTSAQHTADIAKNTADIKLKANAEDVYTISQTVDAVTETVAEIVANADDDFDTLRELSDWLKNHSGSAAEMNTAIQTNTKAIADNKADIEANTAEIESNKSDILTAQNQINTQTLITTSGEANSKNWYRVFEVSQKGAVRTGIILINRGYSNGLPEQYILSINIGYYANKINLISRFIEKDSNNVGRAYIDKIRIVRATLSPSKNNCYIDIHYNADLINVIYASILANTTNGEAFSPANFSAAEIPEGYTSFEFDLTDKDVFERLTAIETALSQTTTE